MTKDELRNHCKKMCRRYSCIPDSSAYEEHKLVLDLLDTDDVLTKALVIQALEDVREKVDLRMKAFANAFEESTYAPTRDIYADKMNECREIVKIINRKIAEVEKNEQTHISP